MDTIFQDLRSALRSLRRSPGFVAVAVLTLAFGIGATTAIFSVVEPLLLNPFPFEGGERMAYLWREEAQAGLSIGPSFEIMERWRESATSLDGVEPYEQVELRRAGRDGPAVLSGMGVSPTFLSFLGLEPALGRGFMAEEAAGGGEAVVMLGHAYWKREYGGRPDVLGSSIELDGRVHTVTGVMPPRVASFQKADLWLPFRPDPARRSVRTIARLRPGVSEAAAREELDLLGGEDMAPPGLKGEWRARLIPAGSSVIGTKFRHALLILSGAAGLVLLIACANVAHLFLARAVAREREFAVRAALGAGRRRLMTQLLTESLLLALAAGVLGLLLASWGITAIVSLRPESVAVLERATISTPVLLFASLVSVCTVLLFGLWPALRAARLDPAQALRRGTPGAGGGISARGRKTLVALEVMLTVVLLVGAGLLIRTLIHLQRLDPGFQPAGLFAVRVDLPADRYTSEESREAFRAHILARVRALPGVAGATFADELPPGYGYFMNDPEIEGGTPAAGVSRPVPLNFVAGDFFQVAGIRLRGGRTFTEAEVREKARVVVIGAEMARRFWPDGQAVGRRVRFTETGPWYTVIGIVDDVAAHGLLQLAEEGSFQVYLPFEESGMSLRAQIGVLVVRTQVTTTAAAAVTVAALRPLLVELEPELVVRELSSAESLLAATIATPRFNMVLLTLFAALALLLAAVGLFSVLSYMVGQRTREIGVRVALGAPVDRVVRLVLGEGMVPVGAGLAAGLVISYAAARTVESLVYGIAIHDPLTFVGVPLVLVLVALLASWLPARRAARVDPMVALRAE